MLARSTTYTNATATKFSILLMKIEHFPQKTFLFRFDCTNLVHKCYNRLYQPAFSRHGNGKYQAAPSPANAHAR